MPAPTDFSDETAPPIRVLAVDDHALVLQGIVGTLAGERDIEVVAQASDGFEAVRQFIAHRPDVTLMDVQMPHLDGVEALKLIIDADPAAKVLMLTTFAGDVQAYRAVRGGASAYLLKTELRHDLAGLIRSVHAGGRHLPQQLAMELVRHADAMLSEREVEVLALVADGQSNKGIARQLDIAEDTVKTHLKHITAKLGARDRTHAVTIGLRRGFIRIGGDHPIG